MYNIYKDPEGDLVLVIQPQDNEPVNPMFIYDGGDTALLLRSIVSGIKLPSISDESMGELVNAEDIYVVETDGEEIVRDYFATIRRVDNIQDLISK